MRHLDTLLAQLENPPFDHLARLHLDLAGSLDGPPELTLSVSMRAGNGRQESPKKKLERVKIARKEELELRIMWLLRVTDERRLAPPRVDETYQAEPLGYDGPMRLYEADLDCRLDAAKSMLAPQVIVDVSASLIPSERGSRPACFSRARFQGVLLTPHLIEVKIFDAELEQDDDERWTRLQAWATRAASGHGCTIVPER